MGPLAAEVKLEPGRELTKAVEVFTDDPGTFLNNSLASILTPTIIQL